MAANLKLVDRSLNGQRLEVSRYKGMSWFESVSTFGSCTVSVESLGWAVPEWRSEYTTDTNRLPPAAVMFPGNPRHLAFFYIGGQGGATINRSAHILLTSALYFKRILVDSAQLLFAGFKSLLRRRDPRPDFLWKRSEKTSRST
ncbi:hypothetical protein RRG08_063781 [Elysia crispata]|uniref:Uncharacterized protein n=1 Tax=Elysia crispata TaxID=231223 RepID=A0AAE1AKX0_9GAST|nr:hypothetical protein RRG08_063781 [Elysia crispata]